MISIKTRRPDSQGQGREDRREVPGTGSVRNGLEREVRPEEHAAGGGPTLEGSERHQSHSVFRTQGGRRLPGWSVLPRARLVAGLAAASGGSKR